MGRKGDREKQELLRQLPKVDALLADPSLDAARRRLGARSLTELARASVKAARARALEERVPPSTEVVLGDLRARVEAVLGSRARRVINGTGVILHTNLGRAPLSRAAAAALADSAAGYTSIELDLGSGRRGARGAFAETTLAHLCGAEDALVVNNNAAAVLLVLTALARGRGAVVSRGELVEIGGGFRVPDVLARSGARMLEVGTTNRTRVADYRQAIEDDGDVAVVLVVHQSNFRQIGFVERPPLAQLAQLAHEHGAVLVHDLGGGALLDVADLGLEGEPVVRSSVAAGSDLVCVSCDKLLGGPQGGAIVGRGDLLSGVRRDPLTRALRLGRLPLVALEATLASYLEGDPSAVPCQWMMRRPLNEVQARVEAWCAALAARGVKATPLSQGAAVGGGTLAERPLPSVAAAIQSADPDALAARLRQGNPAVLARIHEGQLLIDGRTVLPDEEDALLDALVTASS